MIVIKVASELVCVCVQCQTEKTRIQRSSPLPHGDVYSGSGTHRFSDKVEHTFSVKLYKPTSYFHSSITSLFLVFYPHFTLVSFLHHLFV